MKKFKKTYLIIIALFISTCITALISYFVFGVDLLMVDSTLDINIHDTYFVISSYHIVSSVFAVSLFYVTLFLAILKRFHLLFLNILLAFTTIYMLYLLQSVYTMVNSLSVEQGTTLYPPLSGGPIIQKSNFYYYFQNAIMVAQCLLILIVGYTGYRTGKNIHAKE